MMTASSITDYAVHDVLTHKATLLRSGVSATGIGLALWERRGGGEIGYLRSDHHTFSLYLRGGNHVRRLGCEAVGERRTARTGSPGAICVMPANSESAWENRGYVRWLHVYYRDPHLTAATGSAAVPPVPIAFGCDPALRELAERFVLALDWGANEDRAALDHALHALLARSLAIEHVTSEFRIPSGGLTGAQCRAVEEAVATSLDERIAVSDLAEIAGLSARQFSRAFAVSYGTAPYEWVLRRRAERARDLLDGGMSAREAAAACGFSSQSHMIRRFKTTFGYPPTTLR